MQPERDGVLGHVGDNLRRLRTELGVSQAALADRSGLSRRTIINLEAGTANVTLSALDRLAEALGTTFTALVAEPSAPRSRIDAVAWRGKGRDSVAHLIGSVPASSEAQLWKWTIAAGDRYQAEPDPEGWHELIVVVSGSLRLVAEAGETVLAAGEHVIFPTAQRYAYEPVGEGAVTFFRTVVA